TQKLRRRASQLSRERRQDRTAAGPAAHMLPVCCPYAAHEHAHDCRLQCRVVISGRDTFSRGGALRASLLAGHIIWTSSAASVTWEVSGSMDTIVHSSVPAHAPLLVVDDDKGIRESLRMAAEVWGYPVAVAASVSEARSYLQAATSRHIV